MDFRRLNPVVRSAGVYERISNSTPCRAYDARLIYLISGDITVGIEDEKKFHLSVGNLLYIPAGARYSLKGKYLRAAVFTFDLTSECPDPIERMAPVAAEQFDEARAHIPTDAEPFDKAILLEESLISTILCSSSSSHNHPFMCHRLCDTGKCLSYICFITFRRMS